MIIIIDNYDSFTYNLFQYVKEYYNNVEVIKNDDINLLNLDFKKTKALILSPGPGKPENADEVVSSAPADAEMVSLIDECVYSRNRCFRLLFPEQLTVNLRAF